MSLKRPRKRMYASVRRNKTRFQGCPLDGQQLVSITSDFVATESAKNNGTCLFAFFNYFSSSEGRLVLGLMMKALLTKTGFVYLIS